MEKKYSAKVTFSQLKVTFGDKLQPLQTTMQFTKDVNCFVKKMNLANQYTANSTLVFK